MITSRLASEAVDAALAWHRLRLWQQYSDRHVVAVRLPGEPEPLFASILGAAGQEFGVVCYRGDDGLAQLRELAYVGGDDTLTIRCRVLAFTMDRPGTVPEEMRTIHARGGYSARIVPVFAVYGKDKEPREARTAELRELIGVLKAMVRAEETGLLRPVPMTPAGPTRLLALTLTGNPKRPDVLAKYETFGSPLHDGDAPPSIFTSPVLEDLADLARLDARWLVGLRPLSGRIRGDERTLYALAVMDEATDKAIQVELMVGDDVEAAARALFEIFRGKNTDGVRGLPREVAFASRRLFEAAAPVLEAHGSTCTFEPSPLLLEGLHQILEARIREPDPSLVPSPEDHRGREAVHDALVRRVAHAVTSRTLLSPKAMAKYFGDPVLLEDIPEPAARAALLEWFLVDYRERKGRRTLAEELLAGDLPPAEHAALESRVASRPALYQVDRVGDDTLHLRDVFSKEPAELHDPRFVGTLSSGDCVAARLCRDGGNVRCIPLGPVVPAFFVPRAIAYLESMGLELSSDGVARGPHFLGRLWPWLWLSMQQPTAQLANTDGDPLVLLNASFTVADPALLVAALASRKDVERSDEEDAWDWFREKGDQRTILGRLQLIGDHLVVEVNSTKRLSRARRWLQRISGVAFDTSTIQEPTVEPPADNQLRTTSGPLPPDALEEIQALLSAHYRKWLDERLSALGGSTPREAAKTREGRAKVGMLIRTMPDPGGAPGLRAPREELLRELGLESS